MCLKLILWCFLSISKFIAKQLTIRSYVQLEHRHENPYLSIVTKRQILAIIFSIENIKNLK